MKIIKLWLIFIVFLCSAAIGSDAGENPNDGLNNLKTWMTGSFSSETQAEMDTNFYNIHLEMVQIWNERKDAIWFYVEQAAAWSLEKPYRQRIYRLKATEDGLFESAVFTFNNPLRFAGAYKFENPLTELTPDSLVERDGCAIILKNKGDYFEGSTIDKYCPSELRGASYATSEVRIEETVLISWDRGFNENDVQVWGAVTGPYIFKKKVK